MDRVAVCMSVSAENSPSASASGPPLTPTCGPCIPSPTLTAPASECNEHWGTTWVETVTAPPDRRRDSDLAASILPG